jgi:tetratricopeptide (TPR) repeat protein
MIKQFAIIFSCLILVFGCSSSKNKDSDTDDLDWVENADFKRVTEVPFRIDNDHHDAGTSGYDSLSKESIQRIPYNKLSSIPRKDIITYSVSLCYRKQFEEGLKLLEKNYKKFKKSPSYWNQIGTCHFLKKDYRKAKLYYTKATDVNNRYAPPINNIGVLLRGEGQDQKALLAFQRAHKLNKNSRTPKFNLAQMFLRYGFVEKARLLFEELYAENKNDSDLTNALATCYLFKNNYKKSVELFEKLNSTFTELPFVGLNYAVALRMFGKPKDAREVFSRLDKGKILNLKAYYKNVQRFIKR